jgi:cytochrome bd ubiquinol oxidase subunit II
MILFWAGLLAVTTSLYVLLDGFDLGVGILFAFADEPDRRRMLSAISPVWDGNETWLVVTGTVMFGAFPAAYAALLSAFYLPLVLMLCALILRGVAFEFRYKSLGFRWFWDLAFVGGSLVATFVQGMTVGALVEGLPMKDGHYIGGTLAWFSPFAALCGLGLVLGYCLLGASWLVRKCEGPIRDRAYRLLPVLTVGVLAFLACAFVAALAIHLDLMNRWLERPYLLVFPLIGAISAYGLLKSAKQQNVPYSLSLLSSHLHGCVRHTGLLVLAIHDSVCAYCRTGSVAADQPCLHVLGCGPFCHAAYAHLHHGGLSAISRKSCRAALRVDRLRDACSSRWSF